jgi:hypothetical protein
MILWPFDAKAAGLGTVMWDAGALVMFAGTPTPICTLVVRPGMAMNTTPGTALSGP